MQCNTRISTRRPPGFTLLEMLVVISIIIALVALTVTAIGNIVDNANRAATRVTIDKAHKLLQQQLDAWARDFRGSDEVKDLAPKFSSLVAHPRGQEALALKALYRLNLPQNAVEAATASAVFRDWATPGKNTPSDADSSELLYLALTKGKVRASTPVDADSFSGNELADTDGDGFLELVDAWGNPLRFYRWPTRLLHPFGFVASTLANGMDSVQTGNVSINNPELGGASFTEVLTNMRSVNPSATFYVVIGREVLQIQEATSGSLTISQRGALSTNAESHPAGSLVKLAAATDIASLVFGTLNSSMLAHDADDPRGDIIDSIIRKPNAAAIVTNYEQAFHTLDSYHTPLIVSAGSDGLFGLVDPANVSAFGHLAALDTKAGTDYSIIVDPLNSVLNDNLTNQMEGLGN